MLVMFALNSLLFAVVGFFLKGWYDRVNRFIDESEIEKFKGAVVNLASDVNEIKEEIKDIKREVDKYIREHL